MKTILLMLVGLGIGMLLASLRSKSNPMPLEVSESPQVAAIAPPAEIVMPGSSMETTAPDTLYPSALNEEVPSERASVVGAVVADPNTTTHGPILGPQENELQAPVAHATQTPDEPDGVFPEHAQDLNDPLQQ